MCKMAQTRADRCATISGEPQIPRYSIAGYMLLITATLIVLTAVILPRLWLSRRNACSLGSMSPEWLAEHRATHSS